MNRFLLTALALLLAAASSNAQSRAADQSAQELALALQRKYDGIKDFSAEFTHTYRGGVLKKKLWSGATARRNPARCDGNTRARAAVRLGRREDVFASADKQVIVTHSTRRSNHADDFLAGKGNLARDFSAPDCARPQVRPERAQPPKSPQREYDSLRLEVAPQTLQLRGLVTSDAQGGLSSFSFTNLKENTGVADKEFAFTIPRGVDVVTDTPIR